MTFLYDQPFLVTTGRTIRNIESAKILIAGDWCSEIKEKLSKNTIFETIDYPISSLHAARIKKEIEVVFDELLSKVAAAYNEVFGLNKKDKYYQIVLGRWLYHFLHNIYEKREILNTAIDKHPQLWMESCGKTYALSSDSDDYNQQSYSSHDFNFRIYSGIADFLNSVQKKYIDIGDTVVTTHASKASFRESLKSSLQSFICLLNKLFQKHMILVVSPYYPKASLYNVVWFFVKSFGAIIHYKWAPLQSSNKGLDLELRNGLSQKISVNSQNQLLNIASELIFYFIPQSFVEHFTTYREESLRWLEKHTKMSRVFTANAIHTYEPFKYLVAEAEPRDLWISQHGAGYGFLEVLSGESYERSLASKYFTWGWGKNVLPHPKLLSDSRIKYINNENIVFTYPTVSQYAGLLESYFIASNYHHTLALSDQLLDQMSLHIRTKILVRQRVIKGFRIHRSATNVRVDSNPRFYDSLSRARLHLSNHIGTPVLESLAMNLPTVILYDPAAHRMRTSAISFFEELKKNKILFEDPIKAAHHLNSVYANIDEWWMCDATQAAVRSFCSRFAQSDRDWRNTWLHALKAD